MTLYICVHVHAHVVLCTSWCVWSHVCMCERGREGRDEREREMRKKRTMHVMLYIRSLIHHAQHPLCLSLYWFRFRRSSRQPSSLSPILVSSLGLWRLVSLTPTRTTSWPLLVSLAPSPPLWAQVAPSLPRHSYREPSITSAIPRYFHKMFHACILLSVCVCMQK